MDRQVLALDLGTRMGWCLGDPYLKANGGSESFAPRRGESPGMRWMKFRRWLKDTFEASAIKLVVYEEVQRHAGTNAAHVYGGLVAVLQEFCTQHGVEFLPVPVGTIKKTATGKGNARKEAMVEACVRKLGVTPVDDNEADARWLLYHALHVEELG